MTRRQQEAETLLGEIRWESRVKGYCECPGVSMHSSKDAKRDCIVYLDGCPTISCFHDNCAGIVEQMNRELRAALVRAESHGPIPQLNAEVIHRRVRNTPEESVQAEEEAFQRVMAIREDISKKFPWSECEAMLESPVWPGNTGEKQGVLFLQSLYGLNDVVWRGELWHTGKPEMVRHFKPVYAHPIEPIATGPFICPAVFRSGTYERKESNILKRPYIVLEGDSVDRICADKLRRKESLTEEDKARNRAACFPIINFFRSMFRLRAIVDSGSKSMHAWFDTPDSEYLCDLRFVLPMLGFDPKVLHPAQPVRFPGVRRKESGRWQKLIYLSPSDRVGNPESN